MLSCSSCVIFAEIPISTITVSVASSKALKAMVVMMSAEVLPAVPPYGILLSLFFSELLFEINEPFHGSLEPSVKERIYEKERYTNRRVNIKVRGIS